MVRQIDAPRIAPRCHASTPPHGTVPPATIAHAVTPMNAFEVDDDVKIESRFPATVADDWCGDFERK